MTHKFTPGPWHIHDEYLDEVRGPKDEMICATYSIEDERANAHLIAAAPEMYEALHVAEWGGNRGEKVCPVCRRLDFEGHKADCLLATALTKAGRA